IEDLTASDLQSIRDYPLWTRDGASLWGATVPVSAAWWAGVWACTTGGSGKTLQNNGGEGAQPSEGARARAGPGAGRGARCRGWDGRQRGVPPRAPESERPRCAPLRG